MKTYLQKLFHPLMIMESNNQGSNETKRTPEEEERIRRYVRLISFVFVIVVVWYGFGLAHFA